MLTEGGGRGMVILDMDQIRKIRNRQQARFLSHLTKTGQLTPALESDVKRAYTYFEEDVEAVIQGNDKETNDERIHNTKLA